MRLWVVVLATLALAIFLVIDPVALVRLGYFCATGHCGIRPRSLAIGVAALVVIWLATKLILDLRRPPPLPAKRPRKKPAPSRARKDRA